MDREVEEASQDNGRAEYISQGYLAAEEKQHLCNLPFMGQGEKELRAHFYRVLQHLVHSAL